MSASRARRMLRKADRAARRVLHGQLPRPGRAPLQTLPAELLWKEAVSDELEFWRRYLLTEGLEWPEEFRKRIDPDSVLDDSLVTQCVREVAHESVSIIDVGAGPLTILGKRYPGKSLHITPTDALADDYDRLLHEAGIDPPVRTISCDGERLLDVFSPESFDIAFARNALDHAYDPLLVISNMIHLVRRRGFVLLKHRRNEGQSACYEGLHQWNFDMSNNDVFLWSKEATHSLSRALRRRVEVSSRYDGEWINCTLRKLP